MDPLGSQWHRYNSVVRSDRHGSNAIDACFQFKISQDGARSQFRVDVPPCEAQAWRNGEYVAPFSTSEEGSSIEEAT